MKLSNSSMVIRDTDSGAWQVTCENILGGDFERLSFTLLIRKSNQTVGELEREAVSHAISLLQQTLEA